MGETQITASRATVILGDMPWTHTHIHTHTHTPKVIIIVSRNARLMITP